LASCSLHTVVSGNAGAAVTNVAAMTKPKGETAAWLGEVLSGKLRPNRFGRPDRGLLAIQEHVLVSPHKRHMCHLSQFLSTTSSTLSETNVDLGIKSVSPSGQADFLFNVGPFSQPVDGAGLMSRDFSPKLAMMGTVGQVLGAVAGAAKKLDPFGDSSEDAERPTGWFKQIPRALRCSALADAFSAFVLLESFFDDCDQPLKLWLLGGMVLSLPASCMVHSVVKRLRPSYQHYRLTAISLRGGQDPSGMQLERLQLYNQFEVPVSLGNMEQRQEGRYWYVTIRTGPELLTKYQLVTHRFNGPAFDPVSWVLEASVDGIDWKQVHTCEATPREVPVARGQPTPPFFQNLETLDAAIGAFRSGFLCEVLSSAASFAWLVAGTLWISDSTGTCVDSAPLLWYSCYLMALIAWSVFGSATLLLIMGAVASAVGGFSLRG